MTDHIEDYLRRVDQHLTLEPGQRQQVLSELRSHLWETVTEMQRLDPSRHLDDIQHQVVQDFGSPADLAIAYNPEGSVVLTDASGTTVLTFSAAVTRAGKVAGEVATKSARAVGKGAVVAGRGLGSILKVLLIVVAVVAGVALLSASLVAVFLFDDIKELVEDNIEESVYNEYIDCDTTPCDRSAEPRGFFLHDDANRVRFELSGHGHRDAPGPWGNVTLRVVDPSGESVFDRTMRLEEGDSVWESGTWAPIPGSWRVELHVEDFKGTLHMRVLATGLPR